MEIEKIILDFVKSKKKELEINGLRGLARTGENEWGFRFTYRDGDFITLSKFYKIKFHGVEKKPIFVTNQKRITKNTKTVKQK